jgi:hypothetical protein
MRLYVSTATDYFAFQANPIFFSVTTVLAWCLNSYIFKFLNGRNIFPWEAMWAFLNGADSVETHDGTLFVIRFEFLF